MKLIILSLLLFVFAQCNTKQKSLDFSDDYSCVISSTKNKYKVEEFPNIQVTIKNRTDEDIYLIGSLDGSEGKRRHPYCYYTIEKTIAERASQDLSVVI